MKREHNITTETPLPSGYTRLNYIEATGTQYIDTGYYVGNKKTRIVGEMTKRNSVGDSTILFGCGSPSDNQVFCNPFFPPNTASVVVYAIGLGHSLATFIEVNSLISFDFTVDIPNNRFEGEIINGNNVARGKRNGLGTIYNNTLGLFVYFQGTQRKFFAKARLSSFLIYENDVLIHNYIPALRDFDSKPGLYDVAAGEFKVNQGTGEFLYA